MNVMRQLPAKASIECAKLMLLGVNVVFVADVANAILDGADCVMLSGVTAKGDYPIECVETMASICKEAEAVVWQKQLFNDIVAQAIPPLDIAQTVAISAVEASAKSLAAAIIVITTSGKSAHLISKFRPRCPIIAVTRNAQIARQAHIFRAILPLYYECERLEDWLKDVDARANAGIKFGKSKGFIKTGDPVVVVTGWKQGSGFTNTMRIVLLVYKTATNVSPYNSFFMLEIIGFVLISIGATIKTLYHEFDTFIINNYFNMSKAAIAVGIIVILISTFGCIAALKRSVCMINVYALVLSCVFIVNMGLSIAAFLLVHEGERTVKINMYASMRKYDSDTRYIWDTAQSRFHCCGVHGPEDWKYYEMLLNQTLFLPKNGTNLTNIVPSSCCKKNICKDRHSIYTQGCLGVVAYLATECSFLFGSGTICVALIEFLGVIFAIILAKSVRALKTQIEVDKNTRLQHLYEQLDNAKRTDNVGPELYTPTSSEA